MIYTIMILITFVVLTYYEDKLWLGDEITTYLYNKTEVLTIKAGMSFFWPITLAYYVFKFLEQVLPRSK